MLFKVSTLNEAVTEEQCKSGKHHGTFPRGDSQGSLCRLRNAEACKSSQHPLQLTLTAVGSASERRESPALHGRSAGASTFSKTRSSASWRAEPGISEFGGASLPSLPSFIWTWGEFRSAGDAPCTASPKVGWALREANLDPCVARILQPPGPDARSRSSTEVSGGLRDARPPPDRQMLPPPSPPPGSAV